MSEGSLVWLRAKEAFRNTEGRRNFPDGIPCLRCKGFKPTTFWSRPGCAWRKNFCLKYGRGMCRDYEEAGKTFEKAERWRNRGQWPGVKPGT